MMCRKPPWFDGLTTSENKETAHPELVEGLP